MLPRKSGKVNAFIGLFCIFVGNVENGKIYGQKQVKEPKIKGVERLGKEREACYTL